VTGGAIREGARNAELAILRHAELDRAMLRHTSRHASAWTAHCFGPFLLLISLFGVFGILLGGPLTFSTGAGLVIALISAIVGGSTTLGLVRKK